ncbi:MAG TPA: AAA-like domain-containing protein [Chloroflexia bacterium]|nr:AAA-like domain-containing protein [Chloroflexia bacterium]
MAEASRDLTFYTVGGVVQASQGVYIPRQADTDLLAWCRAGTFAYVLAPRQLGKSSLMIHTAEGLAAEGIRVAVIDLTAIGTGVTADDWYFGLVYEIGDQLALTTDLPGWWAGRADLSLPHRFTLFCKEVVLREVPGRVVIFVDEIDTTLSLPFTDDFFAAIRSCYDARARAPEFGRLSFVLIGVATPGDLIHDPRRTPFNIGQRVEMTDFRPEEARPLAAGLGLPGDEATQVLTWVLSWTGGHPYLTQRLCQAITRAGRQPWSEPAVADVVRRLFLGAGSSQDNNLQFVRDMLTKRAPDPGGVLQVYRTIRHGRRPVRDEEQSLILAHLKLSGVVRRDHGILRVHNLIYRTVFDDRWVHAHLPVSFNWLLWLRRTLALLTVLFVVSVIGLGVYAETRREEAETARTLAEARELAIRAQTAPDPEVGLLLAIAAAQQLQAGRVPDTNGQIERVLGEALGNSHVRLRLVQTGPVTSAAWSPDGRRIVTAGGTPAVQLWDAATGQPQGIVPGAGAVILALAWSPDGRYLATASRDGSARIWAPGAGAGPAQLCGVLAGHTGEVLDVAWSPDGRRLVTASRDNTARLWDAPAACAGGPGVARAVLAGHTGWVRSAAWSPDGTQIVTASADTTARIWDRVTGRTVQTLQGHIRDVRSAAWSPDGTRIVTASEDKTAKIWDAASGQEQHTLRGHTAEVNSAAWSPDGRSIVTASADATARLWDGASGQETLALRGHDGAVLAAAWSPDGRQIVTASADRTARVWSVAPAPERLVLEGQTQALLAVAYRPDGRAVATGDQAGTVKIWDVATPPGRLLRALPAQKGAVRAVAWSPDGQALATASADGTATIWDAATGQPQGTLAGHTDGLAAVAWSPDGHDLATGSADTTARLWDVGRPPPAGAPGPPALRTLQGHTGGVAGLAWSPDGRRIATASQDGTAKIWDAATGQLQQTLRVPSGEVWAVAWRPDGQALATAGADGAVRIWDSSTGQEQQTLHGPADSVLSLAYSPDGSLLVTAGQDGTARVWDAATGQERRELLGHTGAVLSVAWSPDGRFLITAGADGTARQYAARLADLLALAQTRTTRALTDQEREQLGLPPTATAPVLNSSAVALALTPTPGITLTPLALASSGPLETPLALGRPSGQIAFASNRGNPPDSHIYVMAADGTDQRVLTTAPLDLYPDWAPDGTRLVFMSANPKIPADSPAGDLYITNADGAGRVQLTHGLNAKWPRWSPDGSAILYADGPENRSPVFDLYLITLADHAIRRLTDSPGFDGFPAWTPDGRIVFTSARVDNKTHLFTMNADGSGQQQLTFAAGEQENAAVAPDGRQVAYVSTQDGAEHIYTSALDGTGVRQITSGPGVDRYPTWSPDGQWIAFHSNRDGNFEIYRVPATGGPVQRLTSEPADDDEPTWHR